MIKKLKMQNFQSHKETELSFNPGMNVIVGASDSGKTAIIRALRWVLFNRPGGDEFRSNWGGDTQIELKTKEGQIIRTKTNSENTYQLNDIIFKAFGQDVPEEIKNVLNLDETNVQLQMDSPFLLSDTPGSVALHFNKIAKLDKIDTGLSNVQKKLNQLSKELQFTEKEITAKKSDLEQFENLEEIEIEINKIEKLEEKRIQAERNAIQLDELTIKIERLQIKIKEKSKVLTYEKKVNEILELYTGQRSISEKRKQLKKLALDLYYKQQDILKIEKEVKAEKDINKILLIYENRQKSLMSLTKLSKLYQSIANNKISQEKQENRLKIIEKEFHDNMPEVCPLCNQKIK